MSQAKDEKPVISLERVHKRYGGFVAVHEASFEIRRGEFFSMLGPSGCGKTTLLRMIAGFEEVTSGVLRLGSVVCPSLIHGLPGSLTTRPTVPTWA